MALPTVYATGAVASSTGVALAVPIPAGTVANDILLLFHEMDPALNTAVLGAVTGFAEVDTNSPQSQTTGLPTRLTVRWHRATGAESGTVATPAVTNHQIARIVGIRGAVTSGNPWNVTSGAIAAASGTVNFPVATTTAIDCLIAQAFTTGTDIATAQQTGTPTNAALGSITVQVNDWTTSGTGGGVAVVTGTKATAGAIGTTTTTNATATSTQALMTIAIQGATPPSTLTAPTVTGTPQAFGFAVDPTTVTYTGGGTGTNLMDVLCVNSDATVATPAGWTLGTNLSRIGGQGAYLFHRAGGTTTAAIDMASATNTHVIWVRLKDCAGLDTTSAANAGADGSAGTASVAVTSGALASTRELVVAFAAQHAFTTAPTGYTWSAGYTAAASGAQSTGVTAAGGAVATKTPAGTPAESPSVTWTNSVSDRYTLVAAFAGVTTVSAPPPRPAVLRQAVNRAANW